MYSYRRTNRLLRKTTMINPYMRFYDTDSGEIRISGGAYKGLYT